MLNPQSPHHSQRLVFTCSISYTDTTVQLSNDCNPTWRFWRTREPQARRLRLGQIISRIREEEQKGKTTSTLAPELWWGSVELLGIILGWLTATSSPDKETILTTTDFYALTRWRSSSVAAAEAQKRVHLAGLKRLLWRIFRPLLHLLIIQTQNVTSIEAAWSMKWRSLQRNENMFQETNVPRRYNHLVDSSSLNPGSSGPHNERPLTQTHLFPTKTLFILRQETLHLHNT